MEGGLLPTYEVGDGALQYAIQLFASQSDSQPSVPAIHMVIDYVYDIQWNSYPRHPTLSA